MSYQYLAAYALATVILVICAKNAGKSDKKIAGTVQRLLYAAAAATVANIVAIFARNVQISLFAYGIVFGAYDWVLYFMLKFSLEFIGERIEKYVKIRLMWLLFAADGMQMMMNVVLGHAFECKAYIFKDGVYGYTFLPESFYYVHLLIDYMLVTFCFITLIYKMCIVPGLYKIQYINVFVAAVIVLIVNIIYLKKERGIYISVFFFALVGLAIYYYALIKSPKQLLNRTYSLLVEGMGDAVVLFGMDGKCVSVNRRAEEFFHIPNKQLERYQQKVYDWCNKHELGLYANTVRDIDEMQNGEERHYRVQCRRLEDWGMNYLGSYLIIHDRTMEVVQDKLEKYNMTHDRLTGLFNKEYFYTMSKRRMDSMSGDVYYVICTDIKNFKMVNDVFGNTAGDELLIKVARALHEGLGDNAVYGRIENDRFGITIKKKFFAEKRLLEALQEAIYLDTDEAFPINIYLGVYEVENRLMSVSVMCDRARMALETVKGDYERKIAYYNNTLRDNVLYEQKLAGEAEAALQEKQFVMFLQPQIDANGRVSGGEALVRWQHPRLGLIAPGKFIGVLEKNGMIAKLDYYIWELACQQLRTWKEQGREDIYISVNISPKDLYFMNIYEVFTDLIEKYDISSHNLKLEITETAVMTDLDNQLKLIDRLRAAGFILEMDDFGSGYSSLNMLKDIKVDMLKLDMAFLGETENEERSKKILSVIVEMAKQLEMLTIVEGVENSEQVDFLKQLGCDIFQGYYFAKPMDIQSFERAYMEGGNDCQNG